MQTVSIIPLREKTGNYDLRPSTMHRMTIIPLREKTGNYDCDVRRKSYAQIIPLREKTGNYDIMAEFDMRVNIIPLREKTGNYDNAPTVSKTDLDYTTTRENRELRLSGEEMRYMTNYTTTRENWELRQCDHIEEINFHHIVILAAAEGRACEGRIKRKKGNTGTVLNMENISPQVTSEAPQRANVSFHNILSQESGVKASGGSHCRLDIFPAIFFLLLVEMAFYGIINL